MADAGPVLSERVREKTAQAGAACRCARSAKAGVRVQVCVWCSVCACRGSVREVHDRACTKVVVVCKRCAREAEVQEWCSAAGAGSAGTQVRRRSKQL